MRRRSVQVAPSANLAALGVVPASALLNSDVPCDTTYLDGARDPNTVLMRLRTAAATPGPLLVYLSGRLTVDRRGNRLHLALAGTTAGSVRYTALPWEWLGAELRDRPPGLTTVLLDLASDKTAWPLLQEYGSLPASPSAEVYGVVLPPGWSGGPAAAVSGYTRHWIEQLHAGPSRASNLQVHALAVGAAALPPGALVLPSARELTARGSATAEPPRPRHPPAPTPPSAAPPPTPAPADDPRPHIHALATAGRHHEAAEIAQAWEQHALRTCGFASPEAIHWVEIRADLARMAGNYRLATQLWTTAARTRLGSEASDAPTVHAAAAGALYCWTQLKEPGAALESGPALLDLLHTLPALDPRHLHLAEQRLRFLHRAPSLH